MAMNQWSTAGLPVVGRSSTGLPGGLGAGAEKKDAELELGVEVRRHELLMKRQKRAEAACRHDDTAAEEVCIGTPQHRHPVASI